MSEITDYRAWWEKVSDEEFIREFLANPSVVLRQIAVSQDWSGAPTGSDQETFPTLLPTEALKIIRQQ